MLTSSLEVLLVALPVAVGLAPTIRTVEYKASTYSACVVPSSAPGLPPLVLLPPIGVGIDRTFCGRLIDEWAAQESVPALHAVDVIGMGDSAPKPKMARTLTGGWKQPPRVPREWAEQVVAYITDELREPAVVVGQSNLCTVALEAAALSPNAVCGVVLVGPPAIEALSIDKPAESIRKIWRICGTPIGAALYRFARRKAFLASFSRKNLFADPSLVDDAYLDICSAGARDADTRHAVFSFVAVRRRPNRTRDGFGASAQSAGGDSAPRRCADAPSLCARWRAGHVAAGLPPVAGLPRDSHSHRLWPRRRRGGRRRGGRGQGIASAASGRVDRR